MQSMKVRFFCVTVAWALLCAVLLACGSVPNPVSAQSAAPKDDLLASGGGAGTGTRTTQAGASVPAETAVSAPAVPPAQVYKIGDTGPAGGIVFYDKGAVTNGWRYLAAAPNDIGPAPWGPDDQVGGTSTAVGTGKANTQRIVAVLEERGVDGAALLCTDLNINGYTRWFLPSADELALMYTNLKQKALGGFGNGWYWSSSHDSYGTLRARALRFSDGSQDGNDKSSTYSVRAIRQF